MVLATYVVCRFIMCRCHVIKIVAYMIVYVHVFLTLGCTVTLVDYPLCMHACMDTLCWDSLTLLYVPAWTCMQCRLGMYVYKGFSIYNNIIDGIYCILGFPLVQMEPLRVRNFALCQPHPTQCKMMFDVVVLQCLHWQPHTSPTDYWHVYNSSSVVVNGTYYKSSLIIHFANIPISVIFGALWPSN